MKLYRLAEDVPDPSPKASLMGLRRRCLRRGFAARGECGLCGNRVTDVSRTRGTRRTQKDTRRTRLKSVRPIVHKDARAVPYPHDCGPDARLRVW